MAAAKRKLTQVPDGEQGKKQRRLLNGTVLRHWRSTSLLGRASGDCNLVVRDLVVLTHAGMADGPRDVRGRVRAHKHEEVFLGNALFKVRSCASDRPAFVLEERMEAAEGRPPVVYGYAAMGLPRQHAEQQTLLF